MVKLNEHDCDEMRIIFFVNLRNISSVINSLKLTTKRRIPGFG